jgi:hydrogenase/urease accessory protein HupE
MLMRSFSRYTLLLILTCVPLTAAAHEVRPAFLQITEQVNADGQRWFAVLWKQPAVQNGRLAITPVFPENCELTDQSPPEITNAAFIQRWQTDCNLSSASIHIDGLSMTLTDVMVRYDGADGSTSNFVLRPESPTLNLATDTPSTLSYLWIGVEHLLFGIDHVLFVIGLVLFIRAPWALLKTVTAFTFAHSITLALSVLGWVKIDQGPVEAIIALSILFLARELVEAPDKRSRLTVANPWIMAFIFGLLHGFGFAGALSDVGLPQDDLWLALLLFNVGIELGQLLIIAIVLSIIWSAQRFTALPTITRIGAWGMGCMAAFWTIDRTWLLL